MPISYSELAQFTDKSSRDPKILELYRKHDFLTAYAKHTDLRVKHDPQLAVGGDWDAYGAIQRDFLIAQGLRPNHRLLDVGCGTGRLARLIVPYLEPRNYVGIDISGGVIAYAKRLGIREGWARKEPRFSVVGAKDFIEGFDFAWAFSVFIHLPSEIITPMMQFVGERLSPHGKFLFSYVETDLPDNTRTGLKQFKHPFSFYETVAADLGYSLTKIDWPGRQRIAMMRSFG